MESRIGPSRLAALRTLVAAIDAGGLTAAARELGCTPSAASKQIARLEQALAARLLERTTRRLRPTAAGAELADRVRPLFAAFETAQATVRASQDEVRGRVRISAANAFGRSHLVPLAAELVARHPGLSLDLVLTGARLDFVDDDIDLAVREGRLADSSATAVRLGRADVVLVAAPGYLRRRGRPRTLDDLVRHDLLSVPPAAPAWDVARLRGGDGRRLGLVPRVQVNDLLSVRELAERGAGIALLPDYLVRGAIADGALVRVLPRAALASFPIHLVFPGRRHLPARVRVVVDALRARLQGGL